MRHNGNVMRDESTIASLNTGTYEGVWLHMEWLKRISSITVVGMFLLLATGSLVTNTGSELGCGNSWPFCDGDWDTLATWIEVNHRLVTGVLGILVLTMSIMAWRRLGRRSDIRWLVAGSLFFLVLQSLLGAAAVIWGSPPAVMASHFGVSLASFGAVYLLAVRIFQIDAGGGVAAVGGRGDGVGGEVAKGGVIAHALEPIDVRLRRLVWGALIFTLVVVYAGAYVRHVGAGMACQGWPLCNGAWIPELSGAVGVAFLHRVLAAALLVFVAYMGHQTRRYRHSRPDLFRGAVWAVVFLALQTLSGPIITGTQGSLASQMIHSAIITLYAAALFYLGIQVVQTPVGDRQSRKGHPTSPDVGRPVD